VTLVSVVIVRGVLDAADRSAIVEQRRINQSNMGSGYGYGARNCLGRRYRIGETLELPLADAQDLVARGIVRIVS
jgi:hypothetical protein